MEEIQIKWYAAESEDGERMLKQHAFIHKVMKTKIIREEYNGNISVCGKVSISEDGETGIPFTDIEHENFNPKKACKKCMKIMGIDTKQL